jgi:uncharacterized protein YjiS (DUF1127 family)
MTLTRFVRCLLRRSWSSTAPGGPALESAWARLLRWNADRRHLIEMEDRLLLDVGLTRADIVEGAPFAPPCGLAGASGGGPPDAQPGTRMRCPANQ